MSIAAQKWSIISTLLGLNLLLCLTFGFYPDKWYAFLFILGLGTMVNSMSVLALFFNWIVKCEDPYRIGDTPRRILYLVPCYNETREELTKSLDSLVHQYNRGSDEYGIVIICDGRVRGSSSNTSTDITVKSILGLSDNGIQEFYNNAGGDTVALEMHTGHYKNVRVLLLIKDLNQGKRDSITLVRRLALGESNEVPQSLQIKFITWNDGLPHYIVGMDADTILDRMCTQKLIERVEQEGPHCMGCVGMIIPTGRWNPFVMYQYAEYHYGQYLRRRAQSEITHKVNCLSGCNQVIRVSHETCGDEILNRYSRIPSTDESIFSHIRAYASEDRNHVCLMLSMYPYVVTVQEPEALAWTSVPESVKVFLSQRRRWTLGSLTNDMLLTYLPGINIFERVASFINIVTFSFNPFILASAGFFINAIIHASNDLMLYLSIPMMVPHLYTLLAVPILRGFRINDIFYYYLCYTMYLTLGLPVSAIVYIYALLGMDTFKWGKTRRIIEPILAERTSPLDPASYIIRDNSSLEIIMGEEERETDV